jgi:hypothetical protein
MNSQASEPIFNINRSSAPLYILLGIVVCIFSLNGVLKALGGALSGSFIGQYLTKIAGMPDAIYQSLPGNEYFLTELFFRWLIISIVIFVFLLILNSLWLKSGGVFLSGIGGLALGAFVFTWMSLIVSGIAGILRLIGWIVYIVYIVVVWIVGILLWPPIMYTAIAVAGIAMAILILKALIDNWDEILDFLASFETWKMFFKLSLAGGLIVAFGYLVLKVWHLFLKTIYEAIRDWVIHYVFPVISGVFLVIGWLIAILLITGVILFLLLVLGYHYADQFLAARRCGRSTLRAFDAGFGFGISIAVIFLVCSVNPDYENLITAAWNTVIPFKTIGLIDSFHILMPATAENFLIGLFVKPSLPIFDILSLLIGVFIANCSLTMSLVSGSVREPFRELARMNRIPIFLKLIAGAFITLLVAVGGAFDVDS